MVGSNFNSMIDVRKGPDGLYSIDFRALKKVLLYGVMELAELAILDRWSVEYSFHVCLMYDPRVIISSLKAANSL